MMIRRALWIAAITLAAAWPAIAADPAAVSPASAQSLSGTTTINLQASPEFYALSNGSHAAGNYASTKAQLSVNHTFASNWILGGSFQVTAKNDNTYQYFGEGSVGYKFNVDSFTLKTSVAIGDTGSATGLGANGNANAFYYAFYSAGDLKLNSQWTWNVFELRYRNAFDYTWITPKVATGLTYALNSNNSVYANVGYAWKDTGKGLLGDKVNFTIGAKYNF